MGPNEFQGPPRRLKDGGDGSPRHEALATLLRQVRGAEPTSASKERVWAGVRASRSSGRGWIWLTVPAAVCGLLLGLFLRPSSAPDTLPPDAVPQAWATLTLASGEVGVGAEGDWTPAGVGEQLALGTGLRTGKGSRAHVRVFDDSGLLLGEGTEVRFVSVGSASEVQLQRGSLVATVAKPAPGRQISVIASKVRMDVLGSLFAVESAEGISVRVGEGQVRIGDQQVNAGECWTSATRKIERCAPPAEEGTLRGLTRRGGEEGRVVVEGDPGLEVEADGVPLGHPPIQWWTPARSHKVTAMSGKGEVIERAVTVEPRREVRVALNRPTAAAPQPVPEPPMAPKVPEPLPRHVDVPEPAPEPAPIPAPVPAVAAQPDLAPIPSPPGPDEQYAQALRLSRQGRFAQAATAFEALSRREDRFGALSLYDLGRLRHQSLNDPAGAMAAYGAYRQRFPNGDLRHDVDLSAVEAALALGDSQKSLAESNLFLGRYPASERARQVRRIRADLERDSGDCAAALSDYQLLLAADPKGAEAEDSWYGAARCDAKLGHSAAARERLQRYLELFPTGKYAGQAKETLEKSSR